DRGGRIARSGRVRTALLNELLADSYYRRAPPKSVGREQYGAEFVERLKKARFSKSRLKKTRLTPADLIATATVLTAATIAIAIRMVSTGAVDLIVSGGGVHNPQIMANLTGF